MARMGANPAVDSEPDPELESVARELASVQDNASEDVDVEGQDEAEPEGTEEGDDEPIAEDASDEPIGRRSRREGKKRPKVDLSQFEEFRTYQAERDRQLEDERKRRLALENQQAERTARAAEQQVQQLEQQFRQSVDPEEQFRLLQGIKSAGGYAIAQQVLRWAKHVEERVRAEGLDASDFDPLSYQGEAGARQFENDLLAAKNKKLATDLAEAKRATSPESIARLVRQELAKATKEKGWDTHIAANDGGPVAGSSFERDTRLFNSGKMTPEEYTRRWKDR